MIFFLNLVSLIQFQKGKKRKRGVRRPGKREVDEASADKEKKVS